MNQSKQLTILSVAVAVLFVSVLFLLFLNFQKPTPISTPTTGVLPTTVPVTDPTANWKTYTSTEWKFSVKYPTNWKVVTGEKPSFDILPPDSNKFQTGSVNISLGYNYQQPQVPSDWSDFTLINADQFGNATWAAKNNQSNDIVFQNGNVQVYVGVMLTNSVTKEIFQQILSTFKFTDNQFDESRITDKPLEVATDFLNAYASGDWITAKNLCADKNFDPNTAASYNVTSWHLVSSKYDTDKNYYHAYVDLTTKDGQIHKISSGGTQIEVLMHQTNGVWKALTWYFFQ